MHGTLSNSFAVHEMDSRSPSSPSFRSRASKRSGTREPVGHLFIQGVCYISASHTLSSLFHLFFFSSYCIFSSLISNSLLCLFTTSLSLACPPSRSAARHICSNSIPPKPHTSKNPICHPQSLQCIGIWIPARPNSLSHASLYLQSRTCVGLWCSRTIFSSPSKTSAIKSTGPFRKSHNKGCPTCLREYHKETSDPALNT